MSETEMVQGAADAMKAAGTPKASARTTGECHKCPRHGKGDPYCWQVCTGPAEHSDKGRSYVRLGSVEAEGEFIAANVEDGGFGSGADWREQEDVFIDAVDRGTLDPDSLTEESLLTVDTAAKGSGLTAELSDDVERALVPILANLFGDRSMSDIRLCIFRHVFRGEDLETIGRTLPTPISKQAVFKHLRRMVRDNPVIGKVILQMKRDGHGGARRRTGSQMTLFGW